jgi:hypothetical protein
MVKLLASYLEVGTGTLRTSSCEFDVVDLPCRGWLLLLVEPEKAEEEHTRSYPVLPNSNIITLEMNAVRSHELNTVHQENVMYYGTLQTTTEHYVVLCSKTQPTDVGETQTYVACPREHQQHP